MAMKTRAKIMPKTGDEVTQKLDAMEKMTTVCFRTRAVQKAKVEKIFDQMGLSMSSALNIFLAQVIREKGLPFKPTTKAKGKKEDAMEDEFIADLEEIWDSEILK